MYALKIRFILVRATCVHENNEIYNVYKLIKLQTSGERRDGIYRYYAENIMPWVFNCAEIVSSSAALCADADFLPFLAALSCQIAERYRYQYNDGDAHPYADPYDFLVESAGRVSCKTNCSLIESDVSHVITNSRMRFERALLDAN